MNNIYCPLCGRKQPNPQPGKNDQKKSTCAVCHATLSWKKISRRQFELVCHSPKIAG